MLTPKQEQFCKNLEIKKMSQREAFYDAYPNSKQWKTNVVDVKACQLANDDKILIRRNELREEQSAIMTKEAKWTREDAHKNLTWLLEIARQEIENGGITRALVSAFISPIKELNVIYSVGEKSDGGGVLEDILNAVRGIDND